ncbi:MAG: cytochrome-c peroxidase [Chloroflexi bacterium]|nr:cytochrome-c peroxidase [Chloroflexota bacterium]
MNFRAWRGYALIALGLVVLGVGLYYLWPRTFWSEAEVITLRSLWIGSLPPLPPDPSNRYGDDPRAAALGEDLFYDTRFSSNGEVACVSCHLPFQGFQDALPLGKGVGTTNRRTMPIAGTAYSPWMFWDGRKDSQWAQALGPLESAVEHGGDRTQYAHLIAKYYRSDYEPIFGPLPDLSRLPAHAGPVADTEASAAWEAMRPEDREAVTRIYANMGKAIAAYERTVMPTQTRLDRYVQAVVENDYLAMQTTLTSDEIAGLQVFIRYGNCTRCHNGPLLTDNSFHNTGVPATEGLPEDTGRAAGAQQVLADEFNCLSSYSDAVPEDCDELRFMLAEGDELMRAFKVPSLRGVAERAPYMHAGQFASLEEVIRHYNLAPAAPAGHNELEVLNLTATQIRQLIAFLKTLSPEINFYKTPGTVQ